MSQIYVLEGTGTELIPHLEAHSEERFRLTALSEDNALEDNPIDESPRTMHEVMQLIAERQKDRPYTDGSKSLEYLHEARDGGMYDYDPNK